MTANWPCLHPPMFLASQSATPSAGTDGRVMVQRVWRPWTLPLREYSASSCTGLPTSLGKLTAARPQHRSSSAFFSVSTSKSVDQPSASFHSLPSGRAPGSLRYGETACRSTGVVGAVVVVLVAGGTGWVALSPPSAENPMTAATSAAAAAPAVQPSMVRRRRAVPRALTKRTSASGSASTSVFSEPRACRT